MEISCVDNMNQKSSIVLVSERIHDRTPAICPYSIKIFQIYVKFVQAMKSLEFYSFGVKIAYSKRRIHVDAQRIL